MEINDLNTTHLIPRGLDHNEISLLNISSISSYGNLTYRYDFPIVLSLSITIAIFMALSLWGNTMVILTIIRHKGMRTRTNLFLVNLAVIDILVAIFNMPFSLVTVIYGNWIFGPIFCKFNGFSIVLFLISSIHTLMYIGIHKYICISRPFSKFMTPNKVLLMIATSWIWGTICAVTLLLGWNRYVYKKGTTQCGPAIPVKTTELIHSILNTTTNYAIPLIVMSYCYYHIFKEIERHMVRMRETSNIDVQNSLDTQKNISVTLFLVLTCFLVCWSPYFLFYSSSLAFMKDKTKMPLLANPLAYWCGYMNSACNPIIYAFRSPSFRNGYKEIMCGIFGYRPSEKSSAFPSFKSRNQISSPQKTTKSLLSQTNWISLPSILTRGMNKDQYFEQKRSLQVIKCHSIAYLKNNIILPESVDVSASNKRVVSLPQPLDIRSNGSSFVQERNLDFHEKSNFDKTMGLSNKDVNNSDIQLSLPEIALKNEALIKNDSCPYLQKVSAIEHNEVKEKLLKLGSPDADNNLSSRVRHLSSLEAEEIKRRKESMKSTAQMVKWMSVDVLHTRKVNRTTKDKVDGVDLHKICQKFSPFFHKKLTNGSGVDAKI